LTDAACSVCRKKLSPAVPHFVYRDHSTCVDCVGTPAPAASPAEICSECGKNIPGGGGRFLTGTRAVCVACHDIGKR
jgi:hypothetical protein